MPALDVLTAKRSGGKFSDGSLSDGNVPGSNQSAGMQSKSIQSRNNSAEWRLAERSLLRCSVRQRMSRSPTRVNVSASVQQAALAMQSSSSGCLVVVAQDVPVGIVTERDMIRILADVLNVNPGEKLSIKDFMSAPPVCLKQNASMMQAIELAEQKSLGQIPVTDHLNRLVGLLTREQLAAAQLEALQDERETMVRQVQHRSRELSEANRELQALALEDSLLQVGNRRALEIDMQSAHMNAVRYGHPYALALIDVDYFKLYNDHYGHCAGDRALIAVADCIKESIRRGDRVYRYGGEELLVLMPETSLQEASEAVARLVNTLYDLNIPHEHSPQGRLTISAGLSAFESRAARHSPVGESSPCWRAVLEDADTFLYRAKALGRNQLRSAPSAKVGR